MKKVVLLFLILLTSLYASSQTQKHYLYNIITIDGNFKKEGLKINVDDGRSIERLKDADGKDMKFNTPAAALMYLFSKGWEMYINGSTTQGSMAAGYGSSSTTSYWILRKPCTKEEFEKAVKDGIKQ